MVSSEKLRYCYNYVLRHVITFDMLVFTRRALHAVTCNVMKTRRNVLSISFNPNNIKFKWSFNTSLKFFKNYFHRRKMWMCSFFVINCGFKSRNATWILYSPILFLNFFFNKTVSRTSRLKTEKVSGVPHRQSLFSTRSTHSALRCMRREENIFDRA